MKGFLSKGNIAMSKFDKQRFSELMDDLGVIYDKEVSVTLKRLYWEDLGQYPLDVIESACQAHRRDRDRGRFFPKPADLLARIGGDAAHIPAEAAWAIALESLDENKTVIWTAEIERAREAARPIWEIGDKYGARAAFVKAYESILLATPTPPRYRVSVGNDPSQRREAVTRAVQDGLLTHERAQHFLPAPEATLAGHAIAGLLTGKVVDLPQNDATKARLEALRAMLASSPRTSSTAQHRQEMIDARRKEALEYLNERQAAKG
jgi:hypothetical protein